MSEPNIGPAAQSRLETWGFQAGIICNRSQYDRTGWDYWLEFPTNLDADAVPWDKQSTGHKCVVQVKGTQSTRRRRSVKLSVWNQLVKRPLPAFFVIIHFNDAGDHVEHAYLVHVGESEIRRVLERLREASLDSDGRPLNKRTLDLTWNDENQLSPPYPSSLSEAISDFIGDSLDDYIQWKLELKNSVGYGEVVGDLKVKLRIPDEYKDHPEDLLIDWSLGLVEEIDVIEGEFGDVRFNKRVPIIGADDLESGILRTDRTPVATGILSFESTKHHRIASIQVEVYAPTGVTEIVNDENFKARFRNAYCDVIVSGRHDTLTVNLSFPDPSARDRLDRLVTFGQLCGLMYELEHSTDEVVEVEFNGESLGKIASPETAQSELKDWSETLLAAGNVAVAAGLPQDLQVEVADIYVQAELLSNVNRAVAGEPRSGLMYLGLEEGNQVDMSGLLICIPEVQEVTLGRYSIRVLIGNTAIHHQSSPDKIFLRFIQSTVTDYRTKRRDADWDVSEESDLETLFESYEQKQGFIAIPWWELEEE